MTQEQIYQNIARRTGGDIYIGVVGPVRTGKSTFISASPSCFCCRISKTKPSVPAPTMNCPKAPAGRTIMTTEPKFIPEKAVNIELSGGGSFPGTAYRLRGATWWTVPSAMRNRTPPAW